MKPVRTVEELAAAETKANWDAWVASLPVPKQAKWRPAEAWSRDRRLELDTSYLELSRLKRSRFETWTTERKVYVEVSSNYRTVYRATMSTAGLEKKLPELLALMKERDEHVKRSEREEKTLEVFRAAMEKTLRQASFEMNYLASTPYWSLQKSTRTALSLTCTRYPLSFSVHLPVGRELTFEDLDKLRGRKAQLVELVKLLDTLSKPL